ncbi:DapH/DapD/GlmU-related protein [Flavobacterium sp. MDT1-60]|uniref:acyltransferase n=1 Tax=Flavobacterium sp. MDT1-60 TaxID=1979344 RepID=UPI00177DC4AD|nr:acyltransferase [Flavobacterium sp. MDT1-60]QOG03784.1 acyltransferase [Flavobacterium sp. MDT1-60]
MIKKIYKSLNRRIYYILNKKKYRFISSTAIVQKLLRIDGKENISIEKRVVIQKMTWIAAVPLTNEDNCELSIGEGSIIGHFNHIYATKEIIIGKNVLTADKVYISDNLHQYENIELPIMFQGIKQLSNVRIGDGSWIGENVCIIGASIGENCVIGANSVVTKDIPDYCVAVGAPARIIKKYNIILQKWEKV